MRRGGGGDDLPPPQLVALRPAPLSYNSLISHREEGRRHLWFPTIFGSYSRCSCISSRCSPSGSCTRSARTRRRPSTSSAAAGWGRGSRRCRRRRPTCRAGCSWACRAWPTSPVRPTPCGPPSALPSARISTGSSWRSVCGSIPWWRAIPSRCRNSTASASMTVRTSCPRWPRSSSWCSSACTWAAVSSRAESCSPRCSASTTPR